MPITIAVVVCKLLTGQPEVCHEQIANTDATLHDCNDQAALAKWKAENPLYRGNDWRVARVKCVIGGQYRPKVEL